MQRSGLWNIGRLASRIGDMLDTVIRSPARKYRSAEDVSRLAQFVDQASWSDPTNLDNTFLSYYTWGAAIGLGLDLSLRMRTDHKVTLDHYMRRMWQDYGRPKSAVEGLVARPYTIKDLRDVLAEVSGDPAVRRTIFSIATFKVAMSSTISNCWLAAGLLLRKSGPGRAWIGPVALDFSEGAARISSPTIEDTPAYAAGLDRGDELLSFDGAAVSGPGTTGGSHSAPETRRQSPQCQFAVAAPHSDVTIAIEEDPRLHVVPVEQTGRQLTAAERTFREAWLGTKQ